MSFKEFFIECIWQLPQNLIGSLYKEFISKDIITRINYDASIYECYLTRGGGGLTLGRFIFVNQHFADLEETILHEIGHVKQSRILGPLYLIIIGAPSIIWAATHKIIAPDKSYYWFYTENWANKLMGLNKEGKLEK